jgi:hypothetical protein
VAPRLLGRRDGHHLLHFGHGAELGHGHALGPLLARLRPWAGGEEAGGGARGWWGGGDGFDDEGGLWGFHHRVVIPGLLEFVQAF